MDYENGFGVTSRFWDVIFGTQLAPLQSRLCRGQIVHTIRVAFGT